MSRPLIGVTCGVSTAQWGVWNTRAHVMHEQYADTVYDAGAQPVLLPPSNRIDARTIVDRLDGLIFGGGPDVEPVRYNAEPHSMTVSDSLRDLAEERLLNEALRIGVPVFGICRGMQLINVALGGTLRQHLPDHVGHDEHQPEVGVFGTHPVNIEQKSRLASYIGTRVDVPTYHHQGVDRLAGGLTAVAWSNDGMIEAVEGTNPNGSFLVGVQWHPEQDSDNGVRLLGMLIDATRAGSASDGARDAVREQGGPASGRATCP